MQRPDDRHESGERTGDLPAGTSNDATVNPVTQSERSDGQSISANDPAKRLGAAKSDARRRRRKPFVL
jgi:hypothetical protein